MAATTHPATISIRRGGTSKGHRTKKTGNGERGSTARIDSNICQGCNYHYQTSMVLTTQQAEPPHCLHHARRRALIDEIPNKHVYKADVGTITSRKARHNPLVQPTPTCAKSATGDQMHRARKAFFFCSFSQGSYFGPAAFFPPRTR